MLDMKLNFIQFSMAILVCGAMLANTGCTASKKTTGYLQDFPAGSTPQEVGKLVAYHFVETPHTNFNRTTPPRVITYPETCTWFGALEFADATNDKQLLS